ncbi:STAS domain-containing protein [Streptomyces sp. NRRL F-2580]|uniref:STAS domain-containing protein n=1 Tax=Streptomyces sp. NRRL F-2580 TaxID=1463841 RepID=UPI000B1C26CF|nr:STAS domain-containing protein [Streptomyces sp. NRRL F-2580]
MVAVVGELDYDTSAGLRDLFTTLPLEPGRHLVLDLACMKFCDSSGISALIAARNHAQSAGADLTLAAVPANTLRVLRVIGLDQLFPLHPDAESAVGDLTARLASSPRACPRRHPAARRGPARCGRLAEGHHGPRRDLPGHALLADRR